MKRSVFVLIAVAALLVGALPASAADKNAPLAEATVDVETGKVTSEPDIKLDVGEVIYVRTDDTVTQYSSPRAGCTRTIDAMNPTVVNIGGTDYAQGKVKFTNGSGCQHEPAADAWLSREACGFWGCEWRNEVHWEGPVSVGTWKQVTMRKKCNNSDSDRWETFGEWSQGGWDDSNQVWLSCGR